MIWYSSIWSGCLLDVSLGRCFRHAQPGGDPGADQRHAGEIISLYQDQVVHKKRNILKFSLWRYKNRLEWKRFVSIISVHFSMKPVTLDTWQWWKCWSQGEPCWIRPAMKMMLRSTMLLGTDTQPSSNGCYNSEPRRMYCKLLLKSLLILQVKCLKVFFNASTWVVTLYRNVLFSGLYVCPPIQPIILFAPF